MFVTTSCKYVIIIIVITEYVSRIINEILIHMHIRYMCVNVFMCGQRRLSRVNFKVFMIFLITFDTTYTQI